MAAGGRRYSTNGSQNIASPTVSILGVTSASTIRPFIYFFAFGPEAAPADNSIVWYWQRHTAAGTSTSVTPNAVDPGDPASLAASGQDHTVEPTYTSAAIQFRLGLNQRASYSWWADPFGGLQMPATAANGLTSYPVHASVTALFGAFAHFQE